jgi:hypothetical protein
LSKFLLRAAMVAAVCAASFYALRVWRVSAGSSVGIRALVVSSIVAAAALLGLAVSARGRLLPLGVVLSTAGALLVLCAVVVEYSLGSAEIASLTPDETVIFGSLKATFSGFEASYLEGGVLATVRSDLELDTGSGPMNLTVISGEPCLFEGYHICQLGFDLDAGQNQKRVRTHLGLLKQKAERPFTAGLAVLGAGVFISTLPWRRRRGE